MPTLRFIGRRGLSRRVTHFCFHAPFEHAAGQHIALQAAIEGSPAERFYSIASPPRPDGTIELCVRHDGSFGRHLLGLRAGDTVDCSEPSGTMRLLTPARPAVYFAAGTGVSPIRAILLSHLAANPEANATLALGARRVPELLYRNEFDALADRHDWFRFLPVLSGDDPGWNGTRGRVTDHIDAVLMGRRGVDAYFCGHPAMVSEMRAKLVAAGIPDARQSFERY